MAASIPHIARTLDASGPDPLPVYHLEPPTPRPWRDLSMLSLHRDMFRLLAMRLQLAEASSSP